MEKDNKYGQREYVAMDVSMDNGVYVDGYIWFLNYKINAICKLDYKTSVISIVECISSFGFDCEKVKIYGKIAENNGQIYLLPEVNVPLAIYNIKTAKTDYLQLSIEKNRICGKLFSSLFIHNEFLYLIPYAYDYIVKIDLKNRDIYYIYIGTCKDPNVEYDRISWDGYVKEDKYVLFTNMKSQCVMKLNFETDIVEIILSKLIYKPAAICAGNRNVYVVDMESKCIYKYNSDNYELKKTILIELEGYHQGTNNRIIDCKNKVFLLGRTANMCLAFDKTTEEIVCMDYREKDYEDYYSKWFYYSSVLKRENGYSLIIGNKKTVTEFDETMNVVGKREFRVKNTDLIKFLKTRFDNMIFEGDIKNLSLFMEALINVNM